MMEFFTNIWSWITSHLELLKWIGLGIVAIILSPFLIAIVRALISGVISIFKFIYELIMAPIKAMKKVSNVFRKKDRAVVNEYPPGY